MTSRTDPQLVAAAEAARLLGVSRRRGPGAGRLQRRFPTRRAHLYRRSRVAAKGRAGVGGHRGTEAADAPGQRDLPGGWAGDGGELAGEVAVGQPDDQAAVGRQLLARDGGAPTAGRPHPS